MGFFDRNREDVVAQGYDPSRLPPGQYLTDRFPVLHVGDVPEYEPGQWNLNLFERAGLRSEATHFVGHAEYGYTANLPLADVLGDNALVVWEYEGESIEPIHGGPVRLLVPHLYFWKSPKWLRGIEARVGDAAGFWERNGYHMYGDPFREQRFWGD